MSNTVVVTEVDQQVVEVQTPGPQGASGVTSLAFNSTGTLTLEHAGGTLTAVPSGLTLTGSLGVGTAPSYLVHARSDANATRQLVVANHSTGSSADARVAATNGTETIGLMMRGTGQSAPNVGTLFSSGAYPLTIQTNSAERVRVEADGNVGVGTTTPNYTGFGSPIRVLTVKGASSYGALELASDATPANAGTLGELAWVNAGAGVSSREAAAIVGYQDGTHASLPGGQLRIYTRTNGGSIEERARIDANGAVGIGGAASGARLDVFTTVDQNIIRARNNTSTFEVKLGTSTDSGYVDSGNTDLAFRRNGAEVMRLNGTNVAIGKGTASSKLDVNGTVTATAFSGPLTGATTGAHNGTVGSITPDGGAFTNVSASGTVTAAGFSGPLTGATTGAHNGTVGATTPNTGAFTTISASGTVTAAAFSGPLTGALNGTVGATTPNTGAFTNLSYTGTLTGGTGIVNLGSNQFYKNANGDIGLSQVPSAWGSGINALQTKGGALYSSVTTNMALGQNYYVDGANTKYITANPATYYLQSSGVHTWGYAASGSVGANITFSEAMRIDAAGGFYVGTTSHTPNPGFSVQPSGTINIGNASSPSGSAFAMFYRAGGAIGSITQSGTTAVAFNTTSDERLKKNIVAAPSAGAVLDQIRVVSYDWKSDDSHVDFGVVAQELHEVYPDAVTPGDDAKPWAWDASFLVPLLVKELQELRARVAALEAAA